MRCTTIKFVLLPLVILSTLACGLSRLLSTPIPPARHPVITVTDGPARRPTQVRRPAGPPTVTPTPLAPLPVVDDACANLVLDTLAKIQQNCGTLAADSVCYAGGPPEVTTGDTTMQLEEAAATIQLADLQRVRTAPVNLDLNEWGVAVAQWRPAGSPPGDYLRLALIGDASLSAAAGPSLAAASALTVSTAGYAPQCAGAPHQIILQSPAATTLTVTINGAQLELTEATVMLTAEPQTSLKLVVLAGALAVTAQGERRTLSMGQMVELTLGGAAGLEVVAPPPAPVDFDPALVEFTPVQVVFKTIEIPAGERWTTTGIDLEAGQTVVIMASGLMKTEAHLPWSSPLGHAPDACAAAGRTDWDCKCRTLAEWGTCSLDEVASMTLLGRVGEGKPFGVGAGGVFTAINAGELQLGPNDNFFDDNLAAYQAIVVKINPDPAP